MKRYLVLILLFFLIAFHVTASDSIVVKKNRYHKSLRFYYQAGKVLQTNYFLQGINDANQPVEKFQAFSLQYGIETDGRKLWQQLYGYPTWGFGFYSVNFFNEKELGTPSAIYTFINAPLVKRFKRWSINYEVGFGLTYNWKPYDPITNPYQYAIGSNNTVFIDAGLNADVQLGKHFDLTAGFTFTHFSNGATRVPNYGINLMAPRLGLKYIFKKRPEFIKQEVPKYNKEWEYIVLFAGSVKQLAFQIIENSGDTSHIAETYGIYTLSTGINRQISYKVKFGLGADLSYDNSYNSYIEYKNSQTIGKLNAGNGIKLAVGFYGAFELVINQLSVIIQPGWYVYRETWAVPESPIPPTNTNPIGMAVPKRKPGGSYQRIGL